MASVLTQLQTKTTSNMTINQALARAYNRLKTRVASWGDDAELLLCHLLGKEKSYLFAHGDEQIPLLTYWRYRRLVSRRRHHEPLQYITGVAYFYGHEFRLDPPLVLIPRPETELLVERALEILETREYDVVDVGTGSGCISCSIALASPHTHITAIDRSCTELDVAIKNARHLGVEDRITFIEDDLLSTAEHYLFLESKKPLLFVMNLPYISEPQWQYIPPEVKDFEPRMALLAGVDGLDAYRLALQQIRNICDTHQKCAHILFEIDPAQATHMSELISTTLGRAIQFTIAKDYCGNDRIVDTSYSPA